jgi:hypothetical protein
VTTFTKLFSSILTSTVWQESKEVKLLWVTMLASCDRWGVVEASVPGLAHIAMLTMAETEAALHVLSSPDAHSRTKEHEGRRIEAIDGGWKLLNHHKYRDRASAVDRQEYNRVKQAESRTRREKEKPGSCQPMSNDVNKCQTLSNIVKGGQSKSAMSAHTDTDTDTDTDLLSLVPSSPPRGKKATGNSESPQQTTDSQHRFSRIMGRRLSSAWSPKELAALKALGNIDPSDLESVETFYRENQSNEKAYLRTSLATLLNNFPGEVDKARAWSNATHADRPSTERLKF